MAATILDINVILFFAQFLYTFEEKKLIFKFVGIKMQKSKYSILH